MTNVQPTRSVGLLLASSLDGAIGDGASLLWHLSEDLIRFKALTMGHSCIMGRKTLLSIGRVLPGRQMVVMSKKSNSLCHAYQNGELPDYFHQCHWADSPQQAISLCDWPDPVWVIGGAEIYHVMEGFAHFIERTEVDGHWPEAQARFEINLNYWMLVESGDWQISASGLRYRYQRFERMGD